MQQFIIIIARVIRYQTLKAKSLWTYWLLWAGILFLASKVSILHPCAIHKHYNFSYQHRKWFRQCQFNERSFIEHFKSDTEGAVGRKHSKLWINECYILTKFPPSAFHFGKQHYVFLLAQICIWFLWLFFELVNCAAYFGERRRKVITDVKLLIIFIDIKQSICNRHLPRAGLARWLGHANGWVVEMDAVGIFNHFFCRIQKL